MKHVKWVFGIAVLCAIGCSPKATFKDDKGNEVTVSKDGTKVEIKSEDGSGEMKVDESGNFEFRDEKGNVISSGTGTVTEEQLGVKFYPGSKEKTGGTNIQVEGMRSYISIRSTTDSPKKVHDFYKSLLGPSETSASTGDSFFDAWKKGNRKITIAIARIGDATEITIQSTTEK